MHRAAWRIYLSHHLKEANFFINPLNAEFNPICYLLALLGSYHFLHVSRISVNDVEIPYRNINQAIL